MIAGIVLAAGASERMGRPKALLPIDGRPAVEVVAAALRSGGCERVLVVVGRHAEEIRSGAPLDGVELVEHAGWAAGRTSSLQAGLAACGAGATCVAVALVDMPFVRAETVRALLGAARSHPDAEVVVPAHGGRRGHPIVLSAAVLPRVRALGADEPLHVVVRCAHAVEVPVDDAGVLVDLDTPDDLRRATS